jgi:hypothetical protein
MRKSKSSILHYNFFTENAIIFAPNQITFFICCVFKVDLEISKHSPLIFRLFIDFNRNCRFLMKKILYISFISLVLKEKFEENLKRTITTPLIFLDKLVFLFCIFVSNLLMYKSNINFNISYLFLTITNVASLSKVRLSQCVFSNKNTITFLFRYGSVSLLILIGDKQNQNLSI